MSRSASGSFVLRLWVSVVSGLLLLGAFVVHSVFESFQLHEERGRIEVLGATRLLGSDLIEVAHRLDRPDGAPAGMVTGEIGVERLEKLLGAAVAGPHDEASLYSDSLALLARASGSDPAVAGRAPVPVGLAQRLAEGLSAGTFIDRSPVDGRERVIAYHRLAAHGLVVTLARSRSEQLAHFRRDALRTLGESAVLAALAIGMTIMIHRSWRQREHASREFERLARTDALTGLANRRRFFELAETELARAVRYGSPLSVLMIDIDHFKDVNDSFGHAAGDVVLSHLAGTCRAVLRQVDTAGRVGGEEFAVLLPETAMAGAVEVADRLRAAVESARVPRDGGEPIAITVSIGVATSAPGKSVDDLMSQSDTALYEAKRAGRNRVVACEEPAGP